MRSTAGAVRRSDVAIDRELAASLWLALLALACTLALFLTWRRLVGAIFLPPSGGALILAAVALGVLAAVARWLVGAWPVKARSTEYSVLSTRMARSLSMASPGTAQSLLFAAPGLVAILLLAALTLPGTPAWGIAVAWFLLVAEEAASWLSRRRPVRPPREVARDEEEPEIPAGMVQRLTRVRERAGESIHAIVRAEFPPHDSLAIVHIAFCPPFASRPVLTAHAVDAEIADIRVAQAETFGARIEIRRARVTDQPQSVLVEVVGSATAP